MQLPTVRGRNLNRKQMTFPDDFSSEVNIVFVPFKRWHQDDVDAWIPFITKLKEEFSNLSYYEFPTLSESNLLYRTLLNEGMRAGIPNNDTREQTITLYLDKAAFRKALDIPNEEHIWVYLFDVGGHVVWRIKGEFTQEKGSELYTAVSKVLQNKQDG
jgi:hypothetical protein